MIYSYFLIQAKILGKMTTALGAAYEAGQVP
jgi:hypothetical protein